MEMYKNTFSRRSLISDGKLSIQNNGKSFHGQKRFHIEPAQVHSIKKVMWERQFCIAQRSIIFSLNYFQTTAICKTYVLCVDKKKASQTTHLGVLGGVTGIEKVNFKESPLTVAPPSS